MYKFNFKTLTPMVDLYIFDPIVTLCDGSSNDEMTYTFDLSKSQTR